jgi:uncharacterized protein (TIGR02246 family)
VPVISLALVLRLKPPMQTQTTGMRRFKLLMFLGIAGLFLLVIRFYREEDSPQESPTQYEKTQQSEAPAPTDNQSTTGDANAEMPKETAKKLVRAWNQGSGQEVADLFTSDGTLTMPNGANIQSKSEIAKLITENRAGPLSETTLTNTVDEVSQQDGKTAVVKGRYQLDGIKVVGFRTAATGTFVLRQIQRDGKWLISKAEIKTGGDG